MDFNIKIHTRKQKKQAKGINEYFKNFTLEEKSKIIYASARFLSVRYFGQLSRNRNKNYRKELLIQAIKRIFEYLLKDSSWISTFFYGERETVRYQLHECAAENQVTFIIKKIEEAFSKYINNHDQLLEPNIVFDKNENSYKNANGNGTRLVHGTHDEATWRKMKDIESSDKKSEHIQYFATFLEEDAKNFLIRDINNENSKAADILGTAVSNAFRTQGFVDYLAELPVEEHTAFNPKTQIHYVKYAIGLCSASALDTPELIEALVLVMPRNFRKIHENIQTKKSNDKIEQFIDVFTKAFYETYHFYASIDIGKFKRNEDVKRDAKISVIKYMVQHDLPDINLSAADVGFPLPLSIRLPTGAAVSAIISLCEYWYKQHSKNRTRRIVHFFEEKKHLEDKVRDIYDCAEFLVGTYLKHIDLLELNDIEIFAQLVVARIFVYVGKNKNTKKTCDQKRSSLPLREVAELVIERAIEKEESGPPLISSPLACSTKVWNRYPCEESAAFKRTDSEHETITFMGIFADRSVMNERKPSQKLFRSLW